MLLGDKPEEGNMCDLWEYQTREMLVRVWVIKELMAQNQELLSTKR